MTRKEHLAAIKQADHEYYDLDNPSMSDAEYDELRRSYIEQYGTEDLDYVPGNVSDGFEKFKHPTPVTSLGKWTKGVDSEEDLKAQIEKLWPVEVQPKYDGLTVVAYPNADGSCRFVTRGLGGEVGEVLPNFIPEYEGPGVNNSGYPIRGEVFITPWNFDKLNDALIFDGESPMKNMRNAAAGLLRRKERSPYLGLLSYKVYDLPGQDMTPAEMREIVTNQTKFTFTDGYGADTVEYTDYGADTVDEIIKTVWRVYEDITTLRIYPIDGIVVKSCQQNSGYRFGNTAHHPRNAVAIKPGRTVFTTVVRDVIWQMGRSKATPVAIVDPVEIDGAIVTKASLHNAEQIKKLGLKIGAKVTIYKANEIIPQIGEVLEPGDKDIVLDVCPACGDPLQEVNGQQFCTNPDCLERIAQNIAFLGKKDVLDINGLSIETARKIVKTYKEKALLCKQNVIFMLTVDELEALPGFARKSAEKLFNSIYAASRDVELPRFIKALCIPGIGNDIGKKLADAYGSLEEMSKHLDPSRSATGCTELMGINGIGPIVAEKIACDDALWIAAEDLADVVTIAPYVTNEKEESSMSEYAGKVFVLTGKMPQVRSYYEDLIVKAGAKIGSAVNSKTDYLCIADVNSTSSKAKKARELGTKLISPEELEEMLG